MAFVYNSVRSGLNALRRRPVTAEESDEEQEIEVIPEVEGEEENVHEDSTETTEDVTTVEQPMGGYAQPIQSLATATNTHTVDTVRTHPTTSIHQTASIHATSVAVTSYALMPQAPRRDLLIGPSSEYMRHHQLVSTYTASHVKNMIPSHTAAAMLPHPATIPLYSAETGEQRDLTNDDLIPIIQLSQPILPKEVWKKSALKLELEAHLTLIFGEVKREEEPPSLSVKDVWEYLQPAPGELDIRTEIRSLYPWDGTVILDYTPTGRYGIGQLLQSRSERFQLRGANLGFSRLADESSARLNWYYKILQKGTSTVTDVIPDVFFVNWNWQGFTPSNRPTTLHPSFGPSDSMVRRDLHTDIQNATRPPIPTSVFNPQHIQGLGATVLVHNLVEVVEELKRRKGMQLLDEDQWINCLQVIQQELQQGREPTEHTVPSLQPAVTPVTTQPFTVSSVGLFPAQPAVSPVLPVTSVVSSPIPITGIDSSPVNPSIPVTVIPVFTTASTIPGLPRSQPSARPPLSTMVTTATDYVPIFSTPKRRYPWKPAEPQIPEKPVPNYSTPHRYPYRGTQPPAPPVTVPSSQFLNQPQPSVPIHHPTLNELLGNLSLITPLGHEESPLEKTIKTLGEGIKTLGQGISDNLTKVKKKKEPASTEHFTGVAKPGELVEVNFRSFSRFIKALKDSHTDTAIKETIYKNVRGLAKTVLDSFEEDLHWEEILSLMEARFSTKSTYDAMITDFYLMSQGSKESIFIYSSRLESHLGLICRTFPDRCTPTWRTAVLRERFFTGLDEYFKTNLRPSYNNGDSFARLLDLGRTLESERKSTIQGNIGTIEDVQKEGKKTRASAVISSTEHKDQCTQGEIQSLKKMMTALLELNQPIAATSSNPPASTSTTMPEESHQSSRKRNEWRNKRDMCPMCLPHRDQPGVDPHHHIKDCSRNKEAQRSYWKKKIPKDPEDSPLPSKQEKSN